MSLTIETAVRGVADVLRDRIAPALDDSFAAEVTRLSVMMLTIMGNAADDAVAIRVEENAAMRALFADAVGLVSDPALSARLGEAAGSSDPGLRLSELDGETSRLRTLLIAVHEHVEGQAGHAARAMDQRIWRLMQTAEQARAPRL